jgi:hypothetical protein
MHQTPATGHVVVVTTTVVKVWNMVLAFSLFLIMPIEGLCSFLLIKNFSKGARSLAIKRKGELVMVCIPKN